MEPKSFCCRQEAILHSVFVLFNENTATQSQQHQIWTLHVINNKQEQHNLFHLLPRHYSVLLVENIYCLSSPDACVFYQTACISSQQEAAQSQRSSLTLWSADHALFWFPFDLTVWVHRFPPRSRPCLLALCIGIFRLSFTADGGQSRPNATEVVILV